MMGDTGDDFKFMKERSKAKKSSNLDYSTAELVKRGVSFDSKNNGVHLVVHSLDGEIDFWPSTGKFRVRSTGVYDRGLRNLLKHLD